jgi:hypothetical protein
VRGPGARTGRTPTCGPRWRNAELTGTRCSRSSSTSARATPQPSNSPETTSHHLGQASFRETEGRSGDSRRPAHVTRPGTGPIGVSRHHRQAHEPEDCCLVDRAAPGRDRRRRKERSLSFPPVLASQTPPPGACWRVLAGSADAARRRSVARLGWATSGTAVRPLGRALRAARGRAEQVPEAVSDAAGGGPEAAPDPVALPDLQGANGLDQPLFWASIRSSRLSSGTRAAARLGGATARTAVRLPGRPSRAARARAEQVPEAAEREPEPASDPVVPDLQSGARYTHHKRYRGQGNPNPEQTRPHVVWVGLREIAGDAVLPRAIQAIVNHTL